MKFKQQSVLALKALLDESGYANDEQDHGFGSFAFEHQRADIFSDLREVGYAPRLEHSGGFFENVGALYWYYDPEMTTSEEAQEISEKWAKDAANKGA